MGWSLGQAAGMVGTDDHSKLRWHRYYAAAHMIRTVFVCLAIVGLTLAVYSNVRHFGYIEFDDPDYVRNNPVVPAGLTWNGIKWAFTTGYDSNWHPLAWLSLMLDATIWTSGHPGGFHCTNLALHIANA